MSHLPAPARRQVIDGKEYNVRIFVGDGKVYDQIREPHNPQRVGGFLLSGVCPLYEQVVQHNKNKLVITSQPVEIRTPLAAELELIEICETSVPETVA